MHYLCWDLWTLKRAMREIIEGKGGEKQKSLRILIFNFCFKNNIETPHSCLQTEVATNTFITWTHFSILSMDQM